MQNKKKAVKGAVAADAAGGFAPVVVQASNPLGGGAGAAGGAGWGERGNRAAFAPTAAGGAPAALSFVECFDSSKGVTYFANSATGATVWVLPPGGVVVSRMRT